MIGHVLRAWLCNSETTDLNESKPWLLDALGSQQLGTVFKFMRDCASIFSHNFAPIDSEKMLYTAKNWLEASQEWSLNSGPNIYFALPKCLGIQGFTWKRTPRATQFRRPNVHFWASHFLPCLIKCYSEWLFGGFFGNCERKQIVCPKISNRLSGEFLQDGGT